jgi:hypothetical protein
MPSPGSSRPKLKYTNFKVNPDAAPNVDSIVLISFTAVSPAVTALPYDSAQRNADGSLNLRLCTNLFQL